MPAKLITPPSEEPLTVADAKAHLRVDINDEDAYIGSLITAARQRAESFTGRAFASQTWELALDRFPRRADSPNRHADPHWLAAIELPMPPVASVVSITYVDAEGQTQTLDPADYVLDDYREPARVMPAHGKSWPSARCEPNAVRVRFVCGYGDAEDVPEAIKHAMKLAVGHWYEHRMEVVTGTIATTLPSAFEALLDPYRILSVP